MENIKQNFIDEAVRDIADKKREVEESDKELGVLNTKLKIDKVAFGMGDIKESLKEDFKYSILALEDMIAMEQNRNSEIKKDLEMLEYRKKAIESQFDLSIK